MDYVLGVLAFGKPAVVFLQDAGNSLAFEPPDSVFLRESLEGALHHALASGISLSQRADAFKGIGKVAAASAGDGDLGQRLGAGLEHGDRQLRCQAPQLSGTETSGRSGPYDGHTLH